MTISQMPVQHTYSRRLALSLAVAIALHGILVLIPIYRWLGHHPGEAAGSGGGTLPFAGSLLGTAVVIRTPQPIETAPSQDAAHDAQDDAASDPTDTPPTESVENLEDADLAVDLLPPNRIGGSGNEQGSEVESGVLSGSLRPLGGGGGVQLEMALVPKLNVQPDLHSQIVLKRKIEDEVIVQVLVDFDGYVLDHRVLRSIPRCPECTASAVEAALATVFPPPIHEGQSTQAWVTLSWLYNWRSE